MNDVFRRRDVTFPWSHIDRNDRIIGKARHEHPADRNRVQGLRSRLELGKYLDDSTHGQVDEEQLAAFLPDIDAQTVVRLVPLEKTDAAPIVDVKPEQPAVGQIVGGGRRSWPSQRDPLAG